MSDALLTEVLVSATDLSKLIFDLLHGPVRIGENRKQWLESHLRRSLCCSPYNGSYGIAGWVVCINGSPPHGTLVIPLEHLTPDSAVFICPSRRARRISGERQMSIIRKFRSDYLKSAKEAFHFEPVHSLEAE